METLCSDPLLQGVSKKTLEVEGFRAHPLDVCLFLLRNPKDPSKLEGILGTHDGDGIGGGTEMFEKSSRANTMTSSFKTKKIEKVHRSRH